MLRIVTHIERLLLVHDCVIVPKFGGFVLQAVPAMQHKEEHTFRPLRKEIGFNMTLQHNDGLLPESYMQMHEVSYRQAQLMLEEDVEDIKNILQQYGKLSLGVLGSFSIGEEGQMIFHPGETDLFSVGSYGLPVFHFPVLAPLEMEREEAVLLTSQKEKKDTLYIPISRKLIRTVMASAAAVALFLFLLRLEMLTKRLIQPVLFRRGWLYKSRFFLKRFCQTVLWRRQIRSKSHRKR